MREIKFRVWTGMALHPIRWARWNEDGTMIEVDIHGHPGSMTKAVVMQYTGLKDKNGVEIYEGDIVACWMVGKNYADDKWHHFETVKWDEERGGFHLTGQLTMEPYQEGGWTDQHEVIGNIHENPEMIDG